MKLFLGGAKVARPLQSSCHAMHVMPYRSRTEACFGLGVNRLLTSNNLSYGSTRSNATLLFLEIFLVSKSHLYYLRTSGK